MDEAGRSNDLDAPGRESQARLSLGAATLLAFLAYACFRWSLGMLRLPGNTSLGLVLLASAAAAFGALGLPILGLAALTRAVRPSPREGSVAQVWARAGGAALLGLALWYVGWRLGLRQPAAARVGLETLQDVGKILAAGGVGVALAAGIRDLNLLLPAGLFAAFADFVVVNFGTVKHALSPSNPKGQALVKAVSAQVPPVHPALPPLTIGPADFLFLGLFLACAHRFDMGLARNARILTAVLAVSLLVVLFVGLPVPALAPMSVAFVAANWRRFKLTREELVSTAAVLILIGGLFVAYFIFIYPGKR